MKKILVIATFFISFSKLFACQCVPENFEKKYLSADFVAVITIKETFGNNMYNHDGNQMNIYKAKINIEKIYKGIPIWELNVFGTTTYASSGACEKLVKPNEKYLVLLNKNSNGEYYVSSCSEMSKIDNNRTINSQLKTEQKIFKYLEKNKGNLYGIFVDYFDNSENWDQTSKKVITDFFKTFGKKINGKFGIYKVKIDDNQKIVEIIPIKKTGLNEQKIQELMRKNLEIENYLGSNYGNEFLICLKFR